MESLYLYEIITLAKHNELMNIKIKEEKIYQFILYYWKSNGGIYDRLVGKPFNIPELTLRSWYERNFEFDNYVTYIKNKYEGKEANSTGEFPEENIKFIIKKITPVVVGNTRDGYFMVDVELIDYDQNTEIYDVQSIIENYLYNLFHWPVWKVDVV
jgi:hypothetical protein